MPDLRVLINTSGTVNEEMKNEVAMSTENVKFLLNWNHFGDHLASCMTKLLTDTSYSDIIIATADKHMIYSHRFVLENSSKYFQRLLKNIKNQKGIQLVVALPEVNYEIFKILMNYMYKGESQVPHELLPSVIKAGQILEINGLVNLNENDANGNCSDLITFNPNDEPHPKCTIIHAPNSNSSENRDGTIPSTSRDKGPSKETVKNTTKNISDPKKNRLRSQNGNSNSTVEPIIIEENRKTNKSNSSKSVKSKNVPQEKQNLIQLPLKRKCAAVLKKTSSVSSPSFSGSLESTPVKRYQKRTSANTIATNTISTNTDLTYSEYDKYLPLKIKKENKESESDIPLKPESNEKISIKMELPDEIEGIPYNALQCEYCFEAYNNPSEWVKHMTEQHGDRGYKSFKDKSVNNAVITCVVCSCVLFSEAEWARHLRIWHADGDSDAANFTAP